jgi:hypothetical protein
VFDITTAVINALDAESARREESPRPGSYDKGYAAAKANRDPSPPTTEPARGLYLAGYYDAECGLPAGTYASS